MKVRLERTCGDHLFFDLVYLMPSLTYYHHKDKNKKRIGLAWIIWELFFEF